MRRLAQPRGQCPVYLTFFDATGKRLQLKTADEYRVNPAKLARGPLELLLGEGRVHFARQLANGQNGNGNGRR